MTEQVGRELLNGTIFLSRSRSGCVRERYEIKSVIGEGGSAVCYEAHRTLHDGSVETGKLKEFYPFQAAGKGWYFSMRRTPCGQLVLADGSAETFEKICGEYLDTYRLLRRVMADHPENEILKNYIQHGEILYGCADPALDNDGENGSGGTGSAPGSPATVYIWSPGYPGKGFDVFLNEVRKSPSTRPEEHLRDILTVTSALVDCMKALHTAGLMHLDIKPSNFLIQYDSDFHIRPDSISLFDIDTLCSVEEDTPRLSGTEGFCAPEVKRGRADNRSDIYSLGATLFYAVIIAEEIPDGLYRDGYYAGIDQYVKNSALFATSDTNSDVTVMAGIAGILKRCLAKHPVHRYQSCAELKADLEKVRKRLSRIMTAPAKQTAAGLAEPGIVMRRMLYEHPLYEAMNEKEADLCVLVIGSGTYGQKFIDVCLQAGQMSGVSLHITAVSGNPKEDRDAYLRFRPAITDFVNVGGLQDGEMADTYAGLDFLGIDGNAPEESSGLRFSRDGRENKKILSRLISSTGRSETGYHYVFIALGGDKISQMIARLCSELVWERSGSRIPVCYVSHRVKYGRKTERGNKLYPVCVNDTSDLSKTCPRLGEMAYNTHLSWSSSMNRDIQKERNEFFRGEASEQRYNREASIDFALSVKYKLHSAGIDSEDPFEAADAFEKQVLERRFTNEKARRLFNRMVDLEHRRWVLEKASAGWTAPYGSDGRLDLEACVRRGSTVDTVNRTHPCLVRGSEAAPLGSTAYTNNEHALWDKGEIDPSLDELDRMSLELHRCMKRSADSLRREDIWENPDLVYIEKLIPQDCGEALQAFREFRMSLTNMLDGVKSVCQQYDSSEGRLLQAVAALPYDRRTQIEERLSTIRHAFYPVVESSLYRDYKALDETLIKKIPFILTNVWYSSVAAVFSDGHCRSGQADASLRNIASVTVLKPERLCYLYCFDSDSDVSVLSGKFSGVLTYLTRRKTRCQVTMLVAVLRGVPGEVRRKLADECKKIRNRFGTGDVVFIEADSMKKATEHFATYLAEIPPDVFDGGNALYPSPYENAALVRQIEQNGIPYFEFDWRGRCFVKRIGCESLKYIEDASFIRVEDLFSLMDVRFTRSEPPDFAEDYEVLWRIRTGKGRNSGRKGGKARAPVAQQAGEAGAGTAVSGPRKEETNRLTSGGYEDSVKNWNRLCEILRRYEATQVPLAEIPLRTGDSPVYRSMTFYLISYAYPTVKTLLARFIEYGIIQPESEIMRYTADTCRLKICAAAEYEQPLSALFSDPQKLLPCYDFDVVKQYSGEGEVVEIRCLNPQVRDVNLDPDGSGMPGRLFHLLRKLQEEHLISGLVRNPENPSLAGFVYSAPRVRKLLTSPAEILKLYVYYETRKTGYFDDIVYNAVISRKSGEVTDERDLILTKGFAGMLVMCLADAHPEQEDYDRLNSLADQLSSGIIKVMLCTAEPGPEQNGEILQNRGSMMLIITISDERKIQEIGRTLSELMENCGRRCIASMQEFCGEKI